MSQGSEVAELAACHDTMTALADHDLPPSEWLINSLTTVILLCRAYSICEMRYELYSKLVYDGITRVAYS